ncbi:MAG: hypothetical protein AABM30_05530 [Actinomycetota bacterium]
MTGARVYEPPLTGWRFVLDTCGHRPNLRRTSRIALVVGIVLTLINQADVRS